ncbi:TetR/AcrR family transcriptional regulator [Pseudonocardia benzenivorans]|jgi:AcrR family transcriptional regulator|uniref:Regulatory protein TetR n=2 Tax=Pseudonocardia TaxID=1847 RepID=F4CP74_PSEUX|nr:TetR/AcrR family transcriptional regulator [Pseudonocardia dioxanivorans]AEA23633.1 regulatory protein TetR [Pseudonocardia dioxanivorans CB1190]GJF06013.1 hypothetical protein PSD17_49610 [Pseudonocardia sp. D17]
MPPTDAPRGRTGRPPVTSRADILVAARRLIDRDGWEKLTVRRLAAEMGIGATTLYHHVRDKEDLLLLLLNEYADRIPRPPAAGEPRERIVAGWVAIHDTLGAWPWAAEVLTVDGFLTGLGDSALVQVEAILAAAAEHGCSQEEAVDLFRNIWYFTVGEILVRARSGGARGADERRDGFLAGIDAAALPRLAAIGDRWPGLSARDTYPDAVRAFVDGLLAQAEGRS